MTNRRSFLTALGAATLFPVVAQAKLGVLGAEDALQNLDDGSLILIDIRTPQEWHETGVAKGAWPLDMTQRDFGPKFLAVLERNPGRQVAIICRTGNRSGYLMDVLAKNGITHVLDVAEGMAGGPNGKGWIPLGLPVVTGEAAMKSLPADLVAI
ncbi:rhodanese-like domain-containing protein [Shimia thalassica]|uniref:rhodanese-like domain-containing protein n=1 Tax=Shimia thalassica TaxID=1715693 RepID=UPI00273618C6|nr:rhodanese-like domain-containing protein [Shimia thalassica]MDP2582205.1 rhodanese-like domain-containing protein [Shimia thalassica]